MRVNKGKKLKFTLIRLYLQKEALRRSVSIVVNAMSSAVQPHQRNYSGQATRAYLHIEILARMKVHDVDIEVIVSRRWKKLPQCKDFPRDRQDWLRSCLPVLQDWLALRANTIFMWLLSKNAVI